jgi:hypothetical protein
LHGQREPFSRQPPRRRRAWGAAISTSGLLPATAAGVIIGEAAGAIAGRGAEGAADWALARAATLLTSSDLANCTSADPVRQDAQSGRPATIINAHLVAGSDPIDAAVLILDQREN